MAKIGEIPHIDGLTVEMVMPRVSGDLCTVCHRRRTKDGCACTSHPHDVAAPVADIEPIRPARRAWSDEERTAILKEAQRAWIERDWFAIERLIRGVCAR